MEPNRLYEILGHLLKWSDWISRKIYFTSFGALSHFSKAVNQILGNLFYYIKTQQSSTTYLVIEIVIAIIGRHTQERAVGGRAMEEESLDKWFLGGDHIFQLASMQRKSNMLILNGK